MKQLLLNNCILLQWIFGKTDINLPNKDKILLVESSKDSMQKISEELTAKGLITWRIGRTDCIVNYYKKHRFNLILIHFNHAANLKLLQKTNDVSLPICLVFDDSLKDQPHTIIDSLLISGCKNYLLNPLTLNKVLNLIDKGKG